MENQNKKVAKDRSVKNYKIAKIGKRNATIIVVLGIAGQIAWAVENSWFNTFVFDELTPDPLPVAWMVAVSAITATITTLFMGSLSDRSYTKWGRRKPYILFGYILWGVITAIFPMVSFIPIVGIAVVMVVIIDAIMTFFGSMANDAAYSAWITDIGDPTNRNRINSLNSATVLIANLIALGAAGIIIDIFGYFAFFYVLGGIVSISGLIAGLSIKEKIIPVEKREPSKKVWKDLKELFSLQDVRENKVLYLLFLNMAIAGIAGMVFFPYLFIYLEHYLGFSKSIIGLIGLIVIGTSTMLVIVIGFVIKSLNRKLLMIILIIMEAIVIFFFAFMVNLWLVTLIYTLSLTLSTFSGVLRGAWMQDNYPEDNIGKFQGVRLIFMVLIPMVIGPFIGTAVIQQFGIPTVIEGESGFIPTPPLIIVNAILLLLALIPLFFIKKSEGKIQFEKI